MVKSVFWTHANILHLVSGCGFQNSHFCVSRHTVPTFRLQPRDAPRHRFIRQHSAYRACFGLRHETESSSLHPAESSSSSYGPLVHLRLLSTPPLGDAVTFSYGVLACPDSDLHRAVMAASQAHSPPAEPGVYLNEIIRTLQVGLKRLSTFLIRRSVKLGTDWFICAILRVNIDC